jgi:probable rRNA maturation factor
MPRRSPASSEAERGGARLSLRVELGISVEAPVDRRLLRRVARRVATAEGLAGPHVLAVHLADDEALRRANREQRGIDRATDVLSFPLLPDLQPGSQAFALPPDEPRHLGDVLISYERAAAQAAEYGHGVEREVCYLLAHGILHLLGHDHEEAGERQRMREREEAALGPLGLAR